MNYMQWRTLNNFTELLKPKYRPISEYWQGLAENEFHLCEVVFTETNVRAISGNDLGAIAL